MTGTEMFYLFYIGMPVVIGTAALVGIWALDWADRKRERKSHPAE